MGIKSSEKFETLGVGQEIREYLTENSFYIPKQAKGGAFLIQNWEISQRVGQQLPDDFLTLNVPSDSS